MPELQLTQEEVQVVSTADDPIFVGDSECLRVAVSQATWTEEDLARARRNMESNEPCYTIEEVLASLQLLEVE